MEAYSVLFWNSFDSMYVFSLGVETAWFAAVQFGVYDIWLITAICTLGAMSGAVVSTAIGYFVGRFRTKIVDLDEDLYERLSDGFSRWGIYMFLLQMLPFSKLFVLFAGLCMVPWRRMLLVLLAGRVLYYVYYLFLSPYIF